MKASFRTLVTKLVALSFLGLLIGWQLGNPWLGLTITLLLLMVVFLRSYQRFNDWLSSGATDKKPRLNGFWANIRDQITRIVNSHEKERAALLADLDFFKDSFQALESSVLVINSFGEIDWANTAAAKMLGIILPRDKGEPLLNLLRAPALIKYIEAARFEEPLLLASPIDAQQRLELQATIFREDFMLIFVRDVTAFAQLEHVRQDFVANISHELRTPLTVINGYLELLAENKQQLPDSVLQVYEKMLVQSKRMDNLVHDLLWLSRLESLPLQTPGEQLGLQAMWLGIIEDASVNAPGIEITFNIAADIFDDQAYNSDALCLQGDYEELRAAFSNLMQNAVKYSEAGGRIEVNCSRYRDTFRVQVKDDGAGIDPVHLPRLTERFYRVDDSRTSATGGTGLGLAIVKHVLKRHDATLQIWSRPGKGSAFTCVFPLARVSIASDCSKKAI